MTAAPAGGPRYLDQDGGEDELHRLVALCAQRRPMPAAPGHLDVAAAQRGRCFHSPPSPGSSARAAAYRALDLLVVARDGELTAGLAAEDQVLADVMGDELRAFDLVQRRVRRLVRAPGRGPIPAGDEVGAGPGAAPLPQLARQRPTRHGVDLVALARRDGGARCLAALGASPPPE